MAKNNEAKKTNAGKSILDQVEKIQSGINKEISGDQKDDLSDKLDDLSSKADNLNDEQKLSDDSLDSIKTRIGKVKDMLDTEDEDKDD